MRFLSYLLTTFVFLHSWAKCPVGTDTGNQDYITDISVEGTQASISKLIMPKDDEDIILYADGNGASDWSAFIKMKFNKEVVWEKSFAATAKREAVKLSFDETTIAFAVETYATSNAAIILLDRSNGDIKKSI